MLLNKKDKLEQIIIDAAYEMEELKRQMNDGEIEEKTDVAKLLYDDFVMVKAESTLELLRLRLKEVLDEVQEDDQDQEDDA